MIWIEIGVFEHWGRQPHGIPRVTQNLFLESLKHTVNYFYYHRGRKVFVVVNDISAFLARANGHVEPLPLGGGRLSLGENDHALFLEAGWDHDGYVSALRQLRIACPKAQFILLVNDLIALRFPNFFEPEFGAKVRDFFRSLPAVADKYACISQNTVKDVKEMLGGEAFSFPLGSDIASKGVMANEAGPYVITVGTVEIRKNHILLYQVWKDLEQELGAMCPRLIVVGRVGWLAEEAVQLLSTLSSVEFRHDIPNEELAGLIEGSLFTVFPSKYEGWGLPASESFFLGKVCVTSSAASLPEINPFPELMFSPDDPDEAKVIIKSLITNKGLLKEYELLIPDRFKSVTWADSFMALLEGIG